MGRGAGTSKTGEENRRTIRMNDDIWEVLQGLGGGNGSAGFHKMYRSYMGVAEINDIESVSEKDVIAIVHNELTVALDRNLHKYFIEAVNFWIKNDCKPATIEKYCGAFGVNILSSAVAGDIMKRLEGKGVMIREYGGFRPDIRCNNGISDEVFSEYFKKYSDIVIHEPESKDLAENIAEDIKNMDL